MSETPSKRRRKGREAFDPSIENPMDVQPYKKDSWGYTYYLQDWLDGWNEAATLITNAMDTKEPCAQCIGKKEVVGMRYCPICGRDLRY